ncbi:MAG: hypothetical protein ACO3CI_06500, partial [Schleiferiaceae bacterium]
MVQTFLLIGLAASAALASSRAPSRAEVVVDSNDLASPTHSTKADTLVFVLWNLQNLFYTVANS